MGPDVPLDVPLRVVQRSAAVTVPFKGSVTS
jgi:hypothetical protein